MMTTIMMSKRMTRKRNSDPAPTLGLGTETTKTRAGGTIVTGRTAGKTDGPADAAETTTEATQHTPTTGSRAGATGTKARTTTTGTPTPALTCPAVRRTTWTTVGGTGPGPKGEVEGGHVTRTLTQTLRNLCTTLT